MRRTALARKARLKPVNPKRRARLRAVQFGRQAEVCRGMACCVCFSPPPNHPHHTKSRGAGGLDSSTCPLCPPHHDMVHRWGVKTFIR